ncbi:MAG: RNA polymerase sigma-I factor [Firmicutes bacterium]|nr:RNA polymerase sigma-I factor [Bacillota bacterium]
MGFLFDLTGGTPRELLRRAQAGDPAAREDLIARYEPLILRMASRAVGRYVRKGHDDEASIALIAFDEAITSFDPDRGRGFIRFAEQVIRRRLVDHYRRQRRPEVAMSELEEEDDEGRPYVPVLAAAAWERRRQEEERRARREEILEYERRLRAFGLSLEELVRVSPRHEDSRRSAMAVGRMVAEEPELRDHLMARRELPMKALEARVGVSRKTLERQRKYIIAVALMASGEFPHLEGYLRKGDEG